MTLSYYLALVVLLSFPLMNHYLHDKTLSCQTNSQQQDHIEWDALLREHVSPTGEVNYSGFKQDIDLLEEYLSELSGKVPDNNATREEKLVYYINLYNAATVKLILDYYPVKSIKDIQNPWGKKWIRAGDKLISLGAIEHKMLRKLDEPRIHFAINCASYSCPKLQNRAYKLDKLEAQLEEATIVFVNDPTKNRIGPSRAEVSKIFQWYKSDFTEKGSLVDFINNYSEVFINSGVKLKYIDYNWSLNEAK